MILDWLIVGGGIHGVHIAAKMVGEAGVAPHRIRIVDPEESLLGRWRSFTETTGMTHLRSPAVHHLDPDPMSLLRFAGKRRKWRRGLFVPPYDRPALSLFNAHCDVVMKKYGVSDLHIRESAAAISLECDEAQVRLTSGRSLAASNVVLAIGASEQPSWPKWAPRDDARVHHIFAPARSLWPSHPETVAVVGGGISAVQAALRLVSEGHRVHLVSRHALRKHQFDSDPGWLGPKLMRRFHNEKSFERRRALIATARHKGSVPPDVHHAARLAVEQNRLKWHQGEVLSLESSSSGLELELDHGRTLEVQRVLLATGFTSRRPGGAMLDELIRSASLRCAECGYPIVDSTLRWHPRVRVAGPLAELELGPASRNIAGARHAADRLAIGAGAR